MAMEIDNESIQEFRRLYWEEFKEELTDGQAEAMASNLVELFLLLASHSSKDRQREELAGKDK